MRKRSIYLALGAAMLALTGLAILILFSHFWINRALKPLWLRSFSRNHPGLQLHVEDIAYNLGANRTVIRGIRLRAAKPEWSFQINDLSIAGVPWLNALLGERSASKLLIRSSLQAREVVWHFEKTGYRLRCASLRSHIPDSRVTADALDFGPEGSDQEFFASGEFRRVAFHAGAKQVEVTGVDTGGLLHGNAFRAKGLLLEGATIDALINRDKPRNPNPRTPKMPGEVLRELKFPVSAEAIQVRQGAIRILEETNGIVAGTLSFDDLRLDANGITNRPTDKSPALLKGEAKLMNAGTLAIAMQFPLDSPDLSFDYTGSLSAMDLRVLNPFLEVTGHTRIRSGQLDSASFQIAVRSGRAQGELRGIYRDLDVAILNRSTGTESGLVTRVKTFLVDHVAMHTSNTPDKPGSFRTGPVDYTRKPDERFLHFAWFAIRSGIVELLGLSQFVKAAH